MRFVVGNVESFPGPSSDTSISPLRNLKKKNIAQTLRELKLEVKGFVDLAISFHQCDSHSSISLFVIRIILPTASCKQVQHCCILSSGFGSFLTLGAFLFTTEMALSKQWNTLTLEHIIVLIKEAEKGGRMKSTIAKEFDSGSSTLSIVLKNKDRAIDGFEQSFFICSCSVKEPIQRFLLGGSFNVTVFFRV